MKLKYKFETVDMGDEFIAVPIGENANQLGGVLKLNKSGIEILEYLSNDISEEEIIDNLAKKYDNSKEELERLLQETLKELRVLMLISEDENV